MVFQCRICRSEGAHPAFRAREMMYGTREAFLYFQCSDCGCLQISEVPADLARHYPGDYYSFEWVPEAGLKPRLRNAVAGVREAAYVDGNPLLKSLFQCFLPPVEGTRIVLDSLIAARAKRHHRILDVGCGKGVIMHRLRTGGFTGTAGVDRFVSASHRYGNGLGITKGELSDVEPGWDLITFHHSLEHVEDPLSTLQTAKSKLKRGGAVLVRVPTVSSHAWEEYGVDWVGLDAPRHLFLFSRESLRILAGAAGMTIVRSYDDSISRQFLASEMFKADRPLTEAPLRWDEPGSGFTARQVRDFESLAEDLNRQQRGDQVVLLLQATDEPADQEAAPA